MDVRPKLTLAAALALALALAAPAHGAQTPPPTAGSTDAELVAPDFLPPTPEGYEITAKEAIAVADGDSKVVEQSAIHGRLTSAVQTDDNTVWQVGYKADGREVVQVKVDGITGSVRESWTGDQVAWPMARGYEGQFGHVLNAPYVWIPMALIFLLGLVDRHRPLRVAHLDLVALLAFGISQIYFNDAEIGVSVPLVYPLLVYLLARMLWLGFHGGAGLRPSAPTTWLVIAAVALIAFRITINVADSGVIDVGYAGTIGADKVIAGEPIYGEGQFPDDNRFGDTYGPVNYYAYVPFELALPWSGQWDELAASHAAAIGFDLATVLGLFVCCARLRPGPQGRRLGVIAAFAWLAYPYTAFALQSNSNDALIAALVVWALALFARPVARGALLALAVMAKFAPLVLVPLMAAGERGLLDRWRPADTAASRRRLLLPVAGFSAAFAAVVALMLVHPAIDPGLGTFFDRTVVSQIDRSSPFSLWGQVAGIEWLQTTILAASAVLAVVVSFVPRRRSLSQVAALAAAVVICLQLSVDHWFYLYIPWFLAPLLVALIAIDSADKREAPGLDG